MTEIPQTHSFSATIQSADTGGAYVAIPLDVESVFGKKRVPVTATFDGIPYRGSVVRMGTCGHVLGMTKAIREQVAKQPGDVVDVTITEDLGERKVDLPADLTAAT